MDTMNARRSNRVAVNVNVDVETVLERHSGRITDLSENGAKVEGQPFAVGQKVKLTAEGAAVWGGRGGGPEGGRGRHRDGRWSDQSQADAR